MDNLAENGVRRTAANLAFNAALCKFAVCKLKANGKTGKIFQNQLFSSVADRGNWDLRT